MNQKSEIILVDDNMHDADLMIRAFRKSGMANTFVHLKDGQEALDYIFAEGVYASRDIRDIPKVILLDLKMPKVSGIEVLRRIKSDNQTKDIPVVVISSSKEDPDIKTSYSLGVNSYVVKPVEFDEFFKAISQVGLYWLLINQPPIF
jgi:two-component system response regulator